MGLEPLERRQMLFVNVAATGSTLNILYGQPHPVTGIVQTANETVVLEVEEIGALGGVTTRLNVYTSSNPTAQVFTSIGLVNVQVPNFDVLGVNNNSLTIKAINLLSDADRIIMQGSGRTAAGRWSDQDPAVELQVLFEITGIDHLTLTSGGIINVGGSFTNSEGDASIRAIGTEPENFDSQYNGLVVVGETTPLQAGQPQTPLFSNFVEIVGGEIDIGSDIIATDEIILSLPPEADAPRSLILPYDITVTGNDLSGAAGRLELLASKNIIQLESSTILASHVTAMSNAGEIEAGPWMIQLGSVNNDFDTISLGMVSAPGDVVNVATEGRIGIRDVDDLAVTDFGILAATGQVRIDAAGALQFAAPIQATGLIAETDHSVTSTPGAIMRLGQFGLEIYANDTYTDPQTGQVTGTGNVTLAAPIVIDKVSTAGVRDTTLVTNKIQAAGRTTIAGGLYSPLAGITTITSDQGVDILKPVQVGSSQLNADSTAVTFFDHDLSLVSHGAGIVVGAVDVPGNDAVVRAIQATGIVSIDAVETITIAGSVFAGTQFGNITKLTTTEAVPAIVIEGDELVNVTATGSLETRVYENDFQTFVNPLLGRISISAGAQTNLDGPITADGAVFVTSPGDHYLYAPITARENVVVLSRNGSIDLQGPLASTGIGTGVAYPVAANVLPQLQPNVILRAPTGGISTSGQGTITAGQATFADGAFIGDVILAAQQGVDLAAAIDTPGDATVTSQLGAVTISALVRTAAATAALAGGTVTVDSGAGIIESDLQLGRIVTDTLLLTNTGAGDPVGGPPSDIELLAQDNRIGTVTATNLARGGDVRIANNAALSVAGIAAVRDTTTPSQVQLASTGGIVQTGPITANELVVSNTSTAAITLANSGNDIDNLAGANRLGTLQYVDADDFETGVVRGGPLGVELEAQTLNLSSAGTKGTVRVVSGLAYKTLSVAGGTGGRVDFVTTNVAGGNPNAPFAGTLRDMIGYVNDNTATVADAGGTVAAPMEFAFDEDNYPVAVITVTADLPAITRRASFDGSRLAAGVAADRLGIAGNAGNRAGLSFGVDTTRGTSSSGSTLTRVAAFGFANGSAFYIGSGSNRITDIYAGLEPDGVTPNGNRVGLEIQGTTATSNDVGTLVFDLKTANRFVANQVAGILIRGAAAGNRVQGNVIGSLAGDPALANGDGIRITNAARNTIGSPDAMQIAVDGSLTPSVSNLIAGNNNSGIHVIQAAGGTLANANRIRNNVIEANRGSNEPNTGFVGGAGITVRNSSWVVIGGLADDAGNEIVGQVNSARATTPGIHVVGSGNVRIVSNAIGVNRLAQSGNGNGGDGIRVEQSRDVEISGGNTIGANFGNGISILGGSTRVAVTDAFVGLIDDGTTEGLAMGNVGDGIVINASIGNTVGVGNRVAYNANGVTVTDARAATAAVGNRVFASEIFTNRGAGVRIRGGSGTTVGGLNAGDGNVILANAGHGISLDWTDATRSPTGHLIQGNFIGTGRNGEVDPALTPGNGGSGIVISAGTANVVSHGNVVMNNVQNGISLVGGTGNVVGGDTPEQGNLITDNGLNGVRVAGAVSLPRTAVAVAPARNHVIAGNFISDNGQNGVHVAGPNGAGTPVVVGITVGQKVTATGVTGLGNVIERNLGLGVNVVAGAQQVSVSGNSIAENVGGGMFVQPGANRSTAQTLTLTSAVLRQPSGSGQQVVVTGQLANARYALQQYSVDIYANSPYEEGSNYPLLTGYQSRRFLGRATVTADRLGNATFTLRITAPIEVGEVITAMATALRFESGSTSSQSNAVTVDLPGIPTPRF